MSYIHLILKRLDTIHLERSSIKKIMDFGQKILLFSPHSSTLNERLFFASYFFPEFPGRKVMLFIRCFVVKKAYFQFSSSKAQFIIWFSDPVDNIANTRIAFLRSHKFVYRDSFSPISPYSDNKFKKVLHHISICICVLPAYLPTTYC